MTNRQYYIFQGSPKVYKQGQFEKYVHENDNDEWYMNNCYKIINIGDRIFIYMTGNNAKILAECEITSKPVYKESISDMDYKDGKSKAGFYVKFKKIRNFDNNITRDLLKEKLPELLIISCGIGTVHKMLESEYNYILELSNLPRIFSDIETKELSIEEKTGIEGELIEKKIMLRKRNREIVQRCKLRDGYKCSSCGFYHDDKIVEAHHLNPISMNANNKVTSNDLITLCPTCHRLAHLIINQAKIDYTNKDLLLLELSKINS